MSDDISKDSEGMDEQCRYTSTEFIIENVIELFVFVLFNVGLFLCHELSLLFI